MVADVFFEKSLLQKNMFKAIPSWKIVSIQAAKAKRGILLVVLLDGNCESVEVGSLSHYLQSQMLNVWYIYLHGNPQNYPNVGK